MVFFTCINCGESLRKTKVEMHYMGRCRGPPYVTCVDCLKDFKGDEYDAHVSCVSEHQRYSAKGFVPKATSEKGKKKQENWCEAIQTILASNKNLKGDERQFLNSLGKHTNIPRKKNKFMNFIKSQNQYTKQMELVERVWGIIEEAGKTNCESVETVEQTDVEELAEAVSKEKISKKERKNKNNENSVENVHGNIDEPTNEESKKKKSKKEKETDKVTEDQENASDEVPKEKLSKKKRKNQDNENSASNVNGDVDELTNEEPKRKKSKKAKKTDEIAEDQKNPCEEIASKKKKIKSEENGVGEQFENCVDNIRKKNLVNGETTFSKNNSSSNLLVDLVEEAGGKTTLNKLLHGISEFCKTKLGASKPEKAVKKLHEKIEVTVVGDKVSLIYPSS